MVDGYYLLHWSFSLPISAMAVSVSLQQLVLISSFVTQSPSPFPSPPSPLKVTNEALQSATLKRKMKETTKKEVELDFVKNSMWFDYPDHDTNKSGAVYKFIGEKPMSTSSKAISKLLQRILIGAIILILVLLAYQLLAHTFCNYKT
ncbi:uncharacterized protein C16orf92 homolog isoform X2 [Rhinatrema bivittatum]|uniref:uncharacterized protein C16orf92 homolog isoform X2 n=1 Tax=Rhinatrema bivittatum TaxID=194408 RepID=UPI001128DDA4|nr:uncharacterized protein C16orf92 homolog isoform X2 [Rhinatrema bivittatum]